MGTEQLEQFEQLARRAVACKKWRWMRGMLANRSRVVRIKLDSTVEVWAPGDWIEELPNNALPDLRDPATLGCLLALVREAWGDGVYLFPDSGWYVKGARLKNGSTISLGICTDTEAAALVAALEAAP